MTIYIEPTSLTKYLCKVWKRLRKEKKKNAFDTFISGILSVYWGHMVCTWQKCHNMCNMIHLNMLSFFPTKRTDHLHFALSCCCFLKSSTKFARNRKKNEKKKRRRQNDEDKKKTHKHIFIFLVTFVLFHCILLSSCVTYVLSMHISEVCMCIVTIMCTAAHSWEYFCSMSRMPKEMHK